MRNLIKLFLMGAILAGCQIQTNPVSPPPDPTVVNPPPPPVPPAPPAPQTSCDAAEAHLEAMCEKDGVTNQYCCAVVMLTKKGKSFAQFCEEEQAKGVFVNPDCLSSVANCDDIDSCTTQSE